MTPARRIAATLALAGCSGEPLHGAEPPPPPPAVTIEASTPAPTAAAPPTSTTTAAPAPAPHSPDELATIPRGACVRGPAHGIPRLTVADATGSDPLASLQIVMRRQARTAVNACFERAPRLSGRLVMRIELPSAGGIAKAVVEGGVGDEALHRCVTEALETTEMPSLSGGSLVLRNFVLAVCPDGTAEWPTSQRWP